ncbi:MAG: ABC transporter ATP-binding protein [Halobacteriales archaeon SW_9_67_24]|nr:MAG: ABC transporter ATP-binding protein [Halobacteriales archaeon SW_9_67_24]
MAGGANSEPLLDVRDLTTRFFTEEGRVNAVESVDFTVHDGEVFGVVGESGSGKSVTALSVMDLVESPGEIVAGEVWYRDADLAGEMADDHPKAVDGDAVDLRRVPSEVRRSLRGSSVSMIFQDPMSSFNPSITVGEQIAEAVEVQRRASANPRSTRSRTQGFGLGSMVASTMESHERAIELLDEVGIPDPEARAEEYPHQYSGGMLQRAMVAQALAGEPDLLIADEPTTALDVTIEAQILNLLADLQDDLGMAIVLITHDLGVIARTCDRLGVMYAGEIVEHGSLADVFDSPVHPYTQGLLGSIPDLDDPAPRLNPIEGNVPSLLAAEMDDRCYFADRCPKAMEECLDKPPSFAVDGTGVAGRTDPTGTSATGTDGRKADTTAHTAKCYLADHEYGQARALPEGYFGGSDGGTDT